MALTKKPQPKNTNPAMQPQPMPTSMPSMMKKGGPVKKKMRKTQGK